MEGFVARQDIMPTHLSYLFRAKRPIEPCRALHSAVYKNRPLQPIVDQYHAGDIYKGLLGEVNAEKGQKWLTELFEDKKPVDVNENK